MIKESVLNLESQKIESEYSFIFEDRIADRYFCNCGEQFLSANEEEVVDLQHVLEGQSEKDELYGSVYKDIKLSLDKKVDCPHCNKNFNNPEVKRKLIPIGDYFISGYEFQETDTDLVIYYAKACPGVIERVSNDGEKEYKIVFDESIKYIRFEKDTKRMYFQDFGDSPEAEFDLDGVIKYIDKFFTSDTEKIIKFYSLHMYINRLANFVSDTKNSNIVTEFLEFIRNTPNEVGAPYIKKLLSIFYGIIKYSNLSTIALTKGSQFLYDLMLECEIPSSEKMKNSGATSPVDIFNFLVTKYINKLNEEVNEDNKEAHDFAYKSKKRIEYEKEINKEEEELKYEVLDDDKEAKFIVRENKSYKGGKVIRADGKFQVMDAVDDGTISKFIYKKINNFSEYKQIIKYFKFYDKKGVISLLQKYNLELLTHAIDAFYFRSKMESDELDRVLQIIDSYLETRHFFKSYKNIVHFSFVEYDDAKLMMEVMGFDPKKHFNKIKTYEELVEYHDNLVKYYKVKSEIEKSGAIEEFVSKFKYLETKGEGDYTGPLEIKLFDTAGAIMKEGPEMRHSASEYAPNVAQGTYLMGSIFDRDPNRPAKEMERYTIGFKYDPKYKELEFDQVKGFANQLGSNRFKKLVIDFLTDKDVSFRPIRDLKLKEGNGGDEKL
ncbi:MAG: hypothetical protein AABY15_08975 [Nanoarchaeota archaeon]